MLHILHFFNNCIIMVSDLSVGRSERLGHLTEETRLTVESMRQCDSVQTGRQDGTGVVGAVSLWTQHERCRSGQSNAT